MNRGGFQGNWPVFCSLLFETRARNLARASVRRAHQFSKNSSVIVKYWWFLGVIHQRAPFALTGWEVKMRGRNKSESSQSLLYFVIICNKSGVVKSSNRIFQLSKLGIKYAIVDRC